MRHYKSDHKNIRRIPYGWRLSFSGYHMVNRPQRKIIHKIVSMRNNGDSLQIIADYLNSHDIPTSRDGKWYCATVKKILDLNSKNYS